MIVTGLHRHLAHMNIVVVRSELEGLVKFNGSVYIVDLETNRCLRRKFQENYILCGHAITAIFAHAERDLVPFILEILSVTT